MTDKKNPHPIQTVYMSYRRITLFPVLCKIYEIIILNRLEKFAKLNRIFSDLQFGFQEEIGCFEASFTILETISYMPERANKVFSCFLNVRKVFNTISIDGIWYKLFTELGIKSEMGSVIKDLYTDVNALVLYSGSFSRTFEVFQ